MPTPHPERRRPKETGHEHCTHRIRDESRGGRSPLPGGRRRDRSTGQINDNHDHQVLWVDETLRIAYSIGQDRRVRKSVWNTTTGSPAIAQSFGLRLASAPAGKTWAGDGIFFRLPNGHLFLEERDTGHGNKLNTKLLRSTDDGSTFTTGLSFE